MGIAKEKEDLTNTLRMLVPISALSDDKFVDLASSTKIEFIDSGELIFKQGDTDTRAVYLLAGKVVMMAGKSIADTIIGGTEHARYPLAHHIPRQLSAKAKTSISVVRINTQMLDALLTDNNEQADAYEVSEILEEDDTDWMTQMLQSEAFASLPAENIQSMFMQMEEVAVKAGQTIVEQGSKGDFFYMLRRGRCKVVVEKNGRQKVMAELSAGDSFGEEALISDTLRNASITMLTDGLLMRLAKDNFTKLMQAPLISWVSYDEATDIVKDGGVWLDVRMPNEFKSVSIAGSHNLPLSLLRTKAEKLKKSRKYVTYCDTGKRSSVAAFLLSQRGFDAQVLAGGFTEAKSNAVPDVPPPTEMLKEKPEAVIAAKTTTQKEPKEKIVNFNAEQVAARKKAEQEAVALRDANAKVESEATELRDANAKVESEATELRDANAKAEDEASKLRDANAKVESEATELRDANAEAERRAKEEAERREQVEAELAELKSQQSKAQELAKEESEKRLLAEAAVQKLKEDQEEALERAQQEIQKRKEVEKDASRIRKEAEAAKEKAELEAGKLKDEREKAKIAADSELAKLKVAREEAEKTADEEVQKHQQAAEVARIDAEKQMADIKAEADSARQAAEADAKRIREEAEIARERAEVDVQRLQIEQDAAREKAEAEVESLRSQARRVKELAEEEAKQRSAELETRIVEETERVRIKSEEEAAKLLAEVESARLQAEAEHAQFLSSQENARLSAEQEVLRLKAEADKIKLKAEEETQKMHEVEATRLASEEETSRIKAEAAATRREIEDQAVKRQLEAESIQRKAEEEAAKIKADAENSRLMAEEEVARIGAKMEKARMDVKHENAEYVAQLEAEADAVKLEAEAARTMRDEAETARLAAEEAANQVREEVQSEREKAEREAMALIDAAEQTRLQAAQDAQEMKQAAEAARLDAEKQAEVIAGEAQSTKQIAEVDASRLQIEAEDAQKRAEEVIDKMRAEADALKQQIALSKQHEEELAANKAMEARAEVERAAAVEKAALEAKVAAEEKAAEEKRAALAAKVAAEEKAAEEKRAELAAKVAAEEKAAEEERAEREAKAAEEEQKLAAEKKAVEEKIETERVAEQQAAALMAEEDAVAEAVLKEMADAAEATEVTAPLDIQEISLSDENDEFEESDIIVLGEALDEIQEDFVVVPSEFVDERDDIERLVSETIEGVESVFASQFTEQVIQNEVIPEQQRSKKMFYAGGGIAAALIASVVGWLVLSGNEEPVTVAASKSTSVQKPVTATNIPSEVVQLETPPVIVKPAPVAKVETKPVEPVASVVEEKPKPKLEARPKPTVIAKIAEPTPAVSAFRKPVFVSDALKVGGQGPLMTLIPKGSWKIGSPSSSLQFDERPQHVVNLGSFAMSRFEVSVAEYRRYLKVTGRSGADSVRGKDGSLPVSGVSWTDASRYAKWLSKQTGRKYRLPTEAEWEYAASARKPTQFTWGDELVLNKANCFNCGSQWDATSVAPIGSFAANAFGLHDMAGNVMEWTADCANNSYAGAPTNGRAWLRGDCGQRMVRGGAYDSPSDSLRVKKRASFLLDSRLDKIGIRLVRD